MSIGPVIKENNDNEDDGVDSKSPKKKQTTK